MSPSPTVLRNRLAHRARFRQVELLVAIADLGSVKKAAEALLLTQPSATQALAELEQLLECQLFLRHSRGMTPTAAGATLLPVARNILRLLDQGADRLASLSNRVTHVVRVTSITAAIAGLLASFLPEFCNRHPDIAVQLDEVDASRQGPLLAQGDTDVALRRPPAVLPEGWHFVPLLPDRLAVLAAANHPLAHGGTVSRAELHEALWLSLPTSISARAEFDTLFDGAYGPPRTHSVITASPGMVWALLLQQPLLALLPLSLAAQRLATGELREIPIEAVLELTPIGMLLPTGERGPASERFSDELLRHANGSTQA